MTFQRIFSITGSRLYCQAISIIHFKKHKNCRERNKKTVSNLKCPYLYLAIHILVVINTALLQQLLYILGQVLGEKVILAMHVSNVASIYYPG